MTQRRERQCQRCMKGRPDSPDMIQPQIPLDKIGEIVRIPRFPAVGHGEVWTKCFDLVLV